MKLHPGKFLGEAVLLSCLFSVFSCASSSVSSEPVELPLQTAYNAKRSYFYSIDSQILENACDGSPQSLRQAMSMLHKTSDEDYRDNERMLLAICVRLMKIVWPSETCNQELPEINTPNPYMGAIDSSVRGIYDSSTGNSDFFAMLLPSLVLITSHSHTDYYSLSRSALKAASEIQKDSTLVNYLLGHLERRQGNNKKSLEYFQKAQKKAPLNFEVRYNVAQAYYDCKNYEMALSMAETLSQSHSQSVEVLALSASASYALGNLEKAESYVVRVLSLEPENLEYVLFRTRILLDKKDFIRASSLLDVYSRTDNTARDYLLLRARLQRDWNKNSEAAAGTIGQALLLYPDDVELLLFAASLSAEANVPVNDMKALEISGKILVADPENMEAMQILVSEMIKEKRWQEAYDLSSSLIKREKATEETFNRHIDICIALKKNTEALNLVQDLYTRLPENEDVQRSYIKVLAATGQRSAAIQTINRLMNSSNQKMKSFLYYQRSFFSPDEDAMLNDLRSSLTLNPRNRDALYRLYEVYYSKKDYRRAQYYLKQVVALDSNNPDLLRRNSELDRLLGK